MSETLAALRAYVTAKDHEKYDNLPEDLVMLTVTHNLLHQKMLELRLNRHSTVAEVKEKLYTHCGTPAEFQRLVLRRDGRVVVEVADDSRKLGYYSPAHGMELHIIDENPHSLALRGGLEDVSLVEKYVMSEEDYDKREGTVRDYKRKQLAQNPDFKFRATSGHPMLGGASGGAGAAAGASAAAAAAAEPVDESTVVGIEVGQRCEVQPGARRGSVKYVGLVPEVGEGYWVGIAFDEPLGRHNGTVKGKKYFECADKHGALVRGKNVTTGDYPEVDVLAELDDSDTEL